MNNKTYLISVLLIIFLIGFVSAEIKLCVGGL